MAANWLKEIAAEIPLDDLPEEYQIVAELFGVDGALRLFDHVHAQVVRAPQVRQRVAPAAHVRRHHQVVPRRVRRRAVRPR